MDNTAATFLFSAMIAAESLLTSTFGTMYGAYVSLKLGGGAPATLQLCLISLILALSVISCAIVSIYALFGLGLAEDIGNWITFVLLLVACLPALIACWLSFLMWRD